MKLSYIIISVNILLRMNVYIASNSWTYAHERGGSYSRNVFVANQATNLLKVYSVLHTIYAGRVWLTLNNGHIGCNFYFAYHQHEYIAVSGTKVL